MSSSNVDTESRVSSVAGRWPDVSSNASVVMLREETITFPGDSPDREIVLLSTDPAKGGPIVGVSYYLQSDDDRGEPHAKDCNHLFSFSVSVLWDYMEIVLTESCNSGNFQVFDYIGTNLQNNRFSEMLVQINRKSPRLLEMMSCTCPVELQSLFQTPPPAAAATEQPTTTGQGTQQMQPPRATPFDWPLTTALELSGQPGLSGDPPLVKITLFPINNSDKQGGSSNLDTLSLRSSDTQVDEKQPAKEGCTQRREDATSSIVVLVVKRLMFKHEEQQEE